ncbi:MAG: nucleotide sugar dehydrogenase [Dysgonamonadaceae bacterium]|jgi:UDP-N-acetyl-D-galactosamine dehydrogenase|nr:nucleotide sugar dehydrogenase [Dysgonamonadaceae bacterium]
MEDDLKIGIIGLGYVGLPLAVEFAKKYPVVGYDIDDERMEFLKEGKDDTRSVEAKDLMNVLQLPGAISVTGLFLTSGFQPLSECNIYIITVPTPISKTKTPDLGPLMNATATVSQLLKKGDIVIYESTVYPGCTEEDCVPVLEQSGLKYNVDFFCGYSPERINPGDKVHTLTKIKKVTSGSTPETADKIDALYASIIEAGTHKAPSIKVAEASKAIENAQRDLNISFVNELAMIFHRMGIDTTDVLEAAGTKWNFLKFKPGLVGGHCISVDPYYLSYKAQILGYNPQVILSGRNVNDSMGAFVTRKVMKIMLEKDVKIKGGDVLILGFAFKENCPDSRNTKIIDIYKEFLSFGVNVDVYDPWVSGSEVLREYGVRLLENIDPEKHYNAIILAVAHDIFASVDFRKYKESGTVIFDTKAFINRAYVDGRL